MLYSGRFKGPRAFEERRFDHTSMTYDCIHSQDVVNIIFNTFPG